MTGPSAAVARLRALAATGGLDELCRDFHVRVLTVFGSAARGESAPRDLDIGVLTEPSHVALPSAFGVALADLAGIGEVDLVHLDHGGPLIRERALVGAVALYESVPAAFANAQMAAIAERVETDPMRRLNLDLLAG